MLAAPLDHLPHPRLSPSKLINVEPLTLEGGVVGVGVGFLLGEPRVSDSEASLEPGENAAVRSR